MLVFFSLPRYNEEDGDEEMKVCLYTEGEKLFSKSGLGKAIRHQEKALESVGVSYTTNIKDDYDVLHVNFYGPNSFALAKMAKKHGKKIVYHAHSTEEDFKNGFIFCKQISPAFKKWLIKCYSLGDVIITPTPYSKRLLEGYGIKVEFEKSKTQANVYGHCLEISDLDCTALEKPLKDKIELLQKELERALNERDMRCKQVSELTEKLEQIENTQPESGTDLIIPGTTIDVARMIIQGKTINGEQYNIYGIKEIAEYWMVHGKNCNIEV